MVLCHHAFVGQMSAEERLRERAIERETVRDIESDREIDREMSDVSPRATSRQSKIEREVYAHSVEEEDPIVQERHVYISNELSDYL